MGWQADPRKSPCQTAEDAQPPAILETCPSGEDPPEGNPLENRTHTQRRPPNEKPPTNENPTHTDTRRLAHPNVSSTARFQLAYSSSR